MLESISERLMETVHAGSPTKHPAQRLATIEAAGELRIPFTCGILVGIGETEDERVESLEALARVARAPRPPPGGDPPEPSVVIRPTWAPSCSMTMFVAIVVPWKTCSSRDGSVPASAVSSRMPCTVPCEGSSGRRRELVDEDLARLVVDVDQVGERAADVDSQALHGCEHDLPEVLAALHQSPSPRAPRSSGNDLVDERRDQPARREVEHLLDLDRGRR